MHQPLRPAALLASLVVLSFGCGHKPKPEMPEPVSQEEAPQQIDTPATPSKVSDEPAPAKGLDDAQRIALEERIGFEFDRSDLSAEAREKLSAKAEILRDLPDLSVRVEGHADERGSDEYNLALSNRRAAAAMRYLISQGIAQERLEVVGYGEERPLDPAETEAAWAKNRRDEFRVTSGRLAQQ
jgi:peptidoglycan-associated lipoprotein